LPVTVLLTDKLHTFHIICLRVGRSDTGTVINFWLAALCLAVHIYVNVRTIAKFQVF